MTPSSSCSVWVFVHPPGNLDVCVWGRIKTEFQAKSTQPCLDRRNMFLFKFLHPGCIWVQSTPRFMNTLVLWSVYNKIILDSRNLINACYVYSCGLGVECVRWPPSPIDVSLGCSSNVVLQLCLLNAPPLRYSICVSQNECPRYIGFQNQSAFTKVLH